SVTKTVSAPKDCHCTANASKKMQILHAITRFSRRNSQRMAAKPKIPVKPNAINPECLAESVNRRTIDNRPRLTHVQLRSASMHSNTEATDSSPTGRSVITTGQCAATVGSTTANKRAPSATAPPENSKCHRGKQQQQQPVKHIHDGTHSTLDFIRVIVLIHRVLDESALLCFVMQGR